MTPHEPIRFQAQLYRFIHRVPQLRIAHSEVDRHRLESEFGVPPARAAVIPHGDYQFFADSDTAPDRKTARKELGLGEAEPVALFFGFLREYKGLDLLLTAWPQVLARVPNARLLIAGYPARLAPERRRVLRAQADRVGALHRMEYIPFEEVARYFVAADLIALPYRHISQSGVLYLALALGLPVVATSVGAWPEMLSDGENALLVPPENVPALADSLIRLLKDPTLRTRLSDSGQLLAAEHSWPRVAEKTEQAFQRLVDQR